MATMTPGASTTRTILWAGILMSTLLIAGVAAILPPPPVMPAPSPPFPMIFGVMTLVITLVSFVLPAQTARIAMLKLAPEVREERGAGTRVRILELHGPALERLLLATQPAFILSLALSEVSSMFGLTLNRFGAPLLTSAPFFAAGTLLVALRFPSRSALLARLGKTLDARVVLKA